MVRIRAKKSQNIRIHSTTLIFIYRNTLSLNRTQTNTHTHSLHPEDDVARVAIVVDRVDPDPEREEAEIDEVVEGLDQGREGGVDHDQEREGEVDLDPERREEEEDDSRRI